MINYPYPHFLGGVSKQPENQKEIGTVDSSSNAYPNISEGLVKRRGMYYKNTLVKHASATVLDPAQDNKIHYITTTDETFVIFISPDVTDAQPVKAYKLSDGTGVQVNIGDSAMLDYIRYQNATASTPITKEDMILLSTFDSTFFANKTVVCGVTGTADGSTAVNGVTYGNSGDGTYGLTSNQKVFPSYNKFPSKAEDSGATNDYVNGTLPTANNFYKALTSSVGFPAGVYKASAAPAVGDPDLYALQITDYNNSLINRLTMPLQIVYSEGTGQFDISWPDWEPRKSGDPDTSPGPSFIGRTIDDLVMYKKRMWILADEFIAASAAGSFFQFWPRDALALSNGDTIDETVADTGLNRIKYAIPYRSSLMLFTEGDRQFEIRSTGPMAPDSIAILPTTSYGVSNSLRPIFLGNNLYFISGFENYGQLYEYAYINDAANNVASNVSSHIPEYLPLTLSLASDDPNNNNIMFTSPNSLDAYMYVTQWEGNNKIQNAFVKFNFADVGLEIMSHSNINSVTHFIMKVTDLSSPDDNWVGFDLNINVDVTGATTVVTASGDWSARIIAIGVPVTMSVGLNQIYLRDENNITQSGTFTMKQLVTYINNTVQFDVRVDTDGRDNDFTFEYSAAQLDGSDINWNQIPLLATKRTQNIIYGTGHRSRIYIEDSSGLPVTLVSAEVRGVFSRTLNIK